MAVEVLLQKAAIIERCLKRIHEEYAGNIENLLSNYTKQDSILLNLERACEACIDIALHEVRRYRLGLPQGARESFQLLIQANLLEVGLGEKLQKMVGFRNIAIHEYQNIELIIVQSILDHHLSDFRLFAKWAIEQSKKVIS